MREGIGELKYLLKGLEIPRINWKENNKKSKYLSRDQGKCKDQLRGRLQTSQICIEQIGKCKFELTGRVWKIQASSERL